MVKVKRLQFTDQSCAITLSNKHFINFNAIITEHFKK